MKCMFCGALDSKVIDSRAVEETNAIRRRRECLSCGKRFTTYETIETTPIMVVKNNGEREQFDITKVKRGIIRACEKRPVTMHQIDLLVGEIEKKVYNSLDEEISTKVIGEYVMEGLKELDEVSYVRFASVYKQFKDISTFFDFINDFEKMLGEKDAADIGVELELFDEERVTKFWEDDIEALKAKIDELLADENMGEAEKEQMKMDIAVTKAVELVVNEAVEK